MIPLSGRHFSVRDISAAQCCRQARPVAEPARLGSASALRMATWSSARPRRPHPARRITGSSSSVSARQRLARQVRDGGCVRAAGHPDAPERAGRPRVGVAPTARCGLPRAALRGHSCAMTFMKPSASPRVAGFGRGRFGDTEAGGVCVTAHREPAADRLSVGVEPAGPSGLSLCRAERSTMDGSNAGSPPARVGCEGLDAAAPACHERRGSPRSTGDERRDRFVEVALPSVERLARCFRGGASRGRTSRSSVTSMTTPVGCTCRDACASCTAVFPGPRLTPSWRGRRPRRRSRSTP